MADLSFYSRFGDGNTRDDIAYFYRRWRLSTVFAEVAVCARLWGFGVCVYYDILWSKMYAARYDVENVGRKLCILRLAMVFVAAYCKCLNRALSILFGSDLRRLYFYEPNRHVDMLRSKTCCAYFEQRTAVCSVCSFYIVEFFASRFSSTIRRMTSEKLIPSRFASAFSHANCGLVKTMDRWMMTIQVSLGWRWTNLVVDHSTVKGLA
jgi:hypothetical protein